MQKRRSCHSRPVPGCAECNRDWQGYLQEGSFASPNEVLQFGTCLQWCLGLSGYCSQSGVHACSWIHWLCCATIPLTLCWLPRALHFTTCIDFIVPFSHWLCADFLVPWTSGLVLTVLCCGLFDTSMTLLCLYSIDSAGNRFLENRTSCWGLGNDKGV